MKNPIGMTTQNSELSVVPERDKTGKFVPGNCGGPGRKPGSKNRKPLTDARKLMLDEDYDSVKELIRLSRQTDLDGDLYFKIHQYLSTIQYQDPDKEVDPIDVDPIPHSGVLTDEALLTEVLPE